MSYALYSKYIFLSFAQQLFADHPEYPWTLNPRTTKVIISDKYFFANPLIGKIPAIFVGRGPYQWRRLSIGQMSSMDLNAQTTKYEDMLTGLMTYHIIDKNGLVAERLADWLFKFLTAEKKQFAKMGIHAITGLNMGEEQLLKGPDEVELTVVPIAVRYESQKLLGYSIDPYVLAVDSTVIDEDQHPYLGSTLIPGEGVGRFAQNNDFVLNSGYQLIFIVPPSGVEISATYINALTLAEVTEDLSGQVDGVNTILTLSGPVYTDYPILSGGETYLEYPLTSGGEY
jgi:hypothetical protein